jgi:hypothetical membrane protein
MRPSKMVEVFTDRYPLIGPMIWILSIQYFITQFLVAHAWAIHYSLRLNAISDLGNSACGIYAARYVCSPLHGFMNASFIMLGLTMAAGSLLIYQEFKESTASLVGFSLLAIAGFGTVLVGLFPENSNIALHALGAAMPFLLGNIGLLILGIVLPLPKSLRFITILFGVVSLLAFFLLVSRQYFGLGFGGIERIVAYPQTLWLILFGFYISRSHMQE